MSKQSPNLLFASALAMALTTLTVASPKPTMAAPLFPLSSVRLLKSPFTDAVAANRTYLLALEPDRLLAPFRREAGLEPRKPSYENWENIGLDGHTAGHYLSALADMVASGQDTKDGELRRRLDYMVDELAVCQQASPDGYVGGVPGSKAFWKQISAGHIEAFNSKWVPWYNLHKTFAGLRDAFVAAGNLKARQVLVRLGDWTESVTKTLTNAQMQQMLGYEHGGMNEVLADIYVITQDRKFLLLAQRFNHKALLEPLEKKQDRLTGLHANTQIPKVVGFERIAALVGDKAEDAAARFFWEDVTQERSVAFGGNSVSEHFNNPKDFGGVLEHREGPETCNTYNMLRLTEQLFAAEPKAAYADYYERALYNHILSSINPVHPGFVYFTPIRPGHYRTYSQPGLGFWCCVGTGMENPGRYGQFIYANAPDGLYVNLFIPSELTVAERGLTVRQETTFPDEERTRLVLHVKRPTELALHLRHPGWVAQGGFKVTVNGKPVAVDSAPSSYATVHRVWKDGDRVEIQLPMRTTVEGLPDGSSWYAILHGPIVLASPTGTQDQDGMRAGAGRGDHIASGPLISLDKMPLLVCSPADVPKHVVPDPSAGPLRFRLVGLATPSGPEGLPLQPFFRLQESRYQMYWDVTSMEAIAERQKRLAEEERAKLARDAATIDMVAVGEQQPEVDHQMTGEGMESGTFNGRRWRHGRWFQFTLNSKGVKEFDLAVTYSGNDNGRTFDIFANDTLITTQVLRGENPGRFLEVRYAIPAETLRAAKEGRITIKFVGRQSLAGGVYDVRFLRK